MAVAGGDKWVISGVGGCRSNGNCGDGVADLNSYGSAAGGAYWVMPSTQQMIFVSGLVGFLGLVGVFLLHFLVGGGGTSREK